MHSVRGPHKELFSSCGALPQLRAVYILLYSHGILRNASTTLRECQSGQVAFCSVVPFMKCITQQRSTVSRPVLRYFVLPLPAV